MKTSDFNYNLPKNLISQKPAEPRDSSRLLVLKKKSGKISHSIFRNVADFLKKGDVVVLNNTKVFLARLKGRKTSGGKTEILLIKKISFNKWLAIGKPNLRSGQEIVFKGEFRGKISGSGPEKTIVFNVSGENGKPFEKLLWQIGEPPTPPYIKSLMPKNRIAKAYQTVYAERTGSIAAPTAGFHFTRQLIRKLENKGIIFKYITLHVGLGTFQPISTKNIEAHKMKPEWAEINKKTADFLNKAKKGGKRIVSVGTTTTRTLESFSKNGKLTSGKKFVDIFIFPGYKFRFADVLLTNFHLPKSTPLLMACSFAGKNLLFKAYRQAIKKKYRFYSFGDAMMIT